MLQILKKHNNTSTLLEHKEMWPAKTVYNTKYAKEKTLFQENIRQKPTATKKIHLTVLTYILYLGSLNPAA